MYVVTESTFGSVHLNTPVENVFCSCSVHVLLFHSGWFNVTVETLGGVREDEESLISCRAPVV